MGRRWYEDGKLLKNAAVVDIHLYTDPVQDQKPLGEFRKSGLCPGSRLFRIRKIGRRQVLFLRRRIFCNDRLRKQVFPSQSAPQSTVWNMYRQLMTVPQLPGRNYHFHDHFTSCRPLWVISTV